MESMSNAPYLARGLRTGLALGEHRIEDANLVDGLVDAYGGGHMGLGGEKAAECCALTREDQDRFAVRSYEKALAAQRERRVRRRDRDRRCPRKEGCGHDGREGRDAARDEPRGDGEARAGVQARRNHHRGERVEAQRRRGRPGRRVRRPRARAARGAAGARRSRKVSTRASPSCSSSRRAARSRACSSARAGRWTRWISSR